MILNRGSARSKSLVLVNNMKELENHMVLDLDEREEDDDDFDQRYDAWKDRMLEEEAEKKENEGAEADCCCCCPKL